MTRKIQKLLIANRGEIACRVIKTAKRLGIATVAVYSEVDARALHVKMADEAVYIGQAPASQSYLNGKLILENALKLNVDAIHPGYGFLSENADFADACEQAGIVFIGPPSSAIRAMGSKSAAKAIMEKANVPLVPGYHGDEQSAAYLKQVALKMGLPVLLKAAAGGGGKGMRQVHHIDQFDEALDSAKREAMSSFKDDIMLVEKYLTQPRHVEVQVFCDNSGQGIYLFERDCSLQRRHQKVIEEAPAPNLSETLREQMGAAAVNAAKAINYVGAGTVEFLLDTDGSFYFMEMNTRLQVEHPITEKITGVDLVEWQIRVASGEPLPLQQNELHINGHAFEARIYAEDTQQNFMPSTGTLSLLRPPTENEHVRVDTGVEEGDEVSVFYDPMIAKLVVWDENRDLALQRLKSALLAYHIDGVITNVSFLYDLASHPAFESKKLSTTFIDKYYDELVEPKQNGAHSHLGLFALTTLLMDKSYLQHSESAAARDKAQDKSTQIWDVGDNWRLNHTFTTSLTLEVNLTDLASDGHSEHNGVSRIDLIAQRIPTNQDLFEWDIVLNLPKDTGDIRIGTEQTRWRVQGELKNKTINFTVDGVSGSCCVNRINDKIKVFTSEGLLTFSVVEQDMGEQEDQDTEESFVAPMNGTVVTHLAKIGESVNKGDGVIVIEAMKMEQTLFAPSDGKVESFYYQPGELVEGGAELLRFNAIDDDDE